jgi:hypothetical protein
MKKTSLWTIIISMGLVVAGVLLLWTSSALQTNKAPTWLSALSGHTGGFLVGTASLALIWEVRVKHLFLKDLLNAVRLSSDIRTGGIASFSFNYLDTNWKDLFREAREIDLFFSYARTWRHAHVAEVNNFATRGANAMRVLLPDPDHQPLMETLALRFNNSADEVKRRVEEAVSYFEKRFSENDVTSTCVIYFTHTSPEFAFYRFDKRGVITFFNHLGRTGNVPTFEIHSDGSMLLFAQDEFN